MDRRLLVRLHNHFSKIENPSEKEKSLLADLTAELPFFPITSVSRNDLLNAGFNPSDVTDEEMEQLANRLSESYTDYKFCDDLEIHADQYLEVPKIDEKLYVLVEFPEDSSPFENEEIGYPCFNSEDNGARYVPIMEYVKRCEKYPDTNTLFKPVMWPDSQNYLGETSIDALCEPIEDEKGLAEFGPQAIWVPLCMLNDEESESKYDDVLEEVRTKFAAEIAEADANPDKWYEVFVADETGSTHSEESGDTFDEAIENFERIADEWGIDKTSIDIWENRESPNNILQIK